MLHDVACSPDEVAVFHSLYTAFIWCHAPNGITSFPELNGHHTRPFGQIPDSDSSWRICIGKTLFFSMLHPHNYKAAGGGHAIVRSHRSSAPAGRICRTAFIYSLAMLGINCWSTKQSVSKLNLRVQAARAFNYHFFFSSLPVNRGQKLRKLTKNLYFNN